VGRRSSRHDERAFVVEGTVLVAEAVAAGWSLEAQFTAPDTAPVAAPGVPHYQLASGVIERVASTDTPQGVIAVVNMPAGEVALDSVDLVLVVDRLGDPGNLGTVLRSAEAAGLDAVVVTPGSVDRFNPKTVRASAGALFRVPTITADLADVHDAGFRVLGTSSHRGTSHRRVDWSGRVAVIVGNEAHGLPDDTPVDEWITIQHRGRAESLNVAMAATVLCFEAASQRHDLEQRAGEHGADALDPDGDGA
jgi:RNA methyltransferase, TrmH family